MYGCIKVSCWVITKISLGDNLSPSGRKLSPSRHVSRKNMAVITSNQMQIRIMCVFSLQSRRFDLVRRKVSISIVYKYE